MIQNTPLYWSHIALETASNLGFAKKARYQGLSDSQDFLNLLVAFRTMCGGGDFVLVNPFTKHHYGCKALLHTLVKYSFVEFLFTTYTFYKSLLFFLSLSVFFFFVCYSRKMQYNAISVTAEKVSAPKPIPIPMVSADTFGRYRISVGH